jgi:hypothetical protein
MVFLDWGHQKNEWRELCSYVRLVIEPHKHSCASALSRCFQILRWSLVG